MSAGMDPYSALTPVPPANRDNKTGPAGQYGQDKCDRGTASFFMEFSENDEPARRAGLLFSPFAGGGAIRAGHAHILAAMLAMST